MPCLPARPCLSLLAVACLTVLLGWSHTVPALPLAHALGAAGVQDEDDDEDAVDMEEDDGSDEEEDSEDEEDVDGDDEVDGGSDSQDQMSSEADEEDGDSRAADDDDDHADADEDMLAGDDFEDDSWASGWAFDDADESDDAIAIDHAVFGDAHVWQVFDEDTGDDSDTDSVGARGLPSLRTTPRAPGSKTRPGKPPRQPGDDDDTVYAYGGRPVSALSVPWQAQILYPGAPAKPNDTRPAWQRQHYCGGALIAPDWVLTAAHCIDQQMVDLGFKVRLGAQDISRPGGTTYRIDRIVRHSQYNADSNDVARPPNMYANDIALIRIVPDGPSAAPAPDRIRQIPLNRKPLPQGVPVSATGWGVTGSGNADAINAVMLRVDLQVMPNPVCQQRPGYGPQKIKDTVFCASNPVQSTCRGDSGGPVVLTNGSPVLVGIVSWGKRRCAGDGRPGVYTRIDQYAEWISQAMKLPLGKNSLP